MKRKLSFILSLAIITALIPSPTVLADASGNLLSNGSFEFTDQYDFPQNWSSDGANLISDGGFEEASLWTLRGSGSLSYDTQTFVGGSKSAKMSISKTGTTWAAVAQRDDSGLVPVDNTQSYIFRSYVKAKNNAGDTYYGDMEFLGASKKSLSLQAVSLINGGDWIEYYDEFQPNAGATHITIFQMRTANPTYGAEMWIDNISLEKLGRTTEDDSYDGSKALKIVNYNDGLSDSWISDAVKLEKGKTYLFSFKAKGNSDGYLIDAGTNTKLELSFETEEVSGWTNYHTEVTVDADTDVSVVFDSLNGESYFDDVQINEKPAPSVIEILAEDGAEYINKEQSLTKNFTAKVYSQYNEIMLGEEVLWSTDNDTASVTDGVLTVSSDIPIGTIIKIKAACASDSEIKAEKEIIVTGNESMPVSVTITGKNEIPTITGGKHTKEQYYASVSDQFGKELEDANLIWSIDESKTTTQNISATDGLVSVSENAVGGVLALKVTAEHCGVSKTSELFLIDVIQSVENISLAVNSLKIQEGRSREIKVSINPQNAANRAFTVSSDAPQIANAVIIDDGIEITAKAAGTVNITVKTEDGNFTDSVEVTVAAVTTDIDLNFENEGKGWNYTSWNIISNGDFETDSAFTSGNEAAAESGYTTDVVYEGKRAAYIKYKNTQSTNTWAGFRIYDSQKIAPSSTYHLSIMVNLPTVDADWMAGLNCKVVDTNGATVVAEGASDCRTTAATNGWEKIEANLTIPETAVKISQLGPRANGSYGYEAYYDNARFETIGKITEDTSHKGTGAYMLGAYGGLYGEEYEECISDMIPVSENTTYTVSGYVKNEENSKARIGVRYYDASGNLLKEEFSESSDSTSWSISSITSSAPENTVSMSVVLKASGNGFTYFDEISYIDEFSIPSDIVIEGSKSISTPVSGERNIQYNAYVTDSFGVKMSSEAVEFSLLNAFPGVTITKDGQLTLTKDAAVGKVIIEAVSGELKKQLEIEVIKLISFNIKNLTSSMTVPAYTVETQLEASVTDSTGERELSADEVEFSLDKSYTGITLTGNILTITPSAQIGKVTVYAVWKNDTTVKVSAEMSVLRVPYAVNTGGSGGGGGSSSGGGSLASVSGTNPVDASVTVTEPVIDTSDGTMSAIFDDLSVNHWAYDYIMEFYRRGYINGKTSSKFDPDGQITRAEFIAVLVRMLDLSGMAEVNFSDVLQSDWCYDYITAAVAEGLIMGYDDGTFGKDRPISREEISVIVTRTADKFNIDLENTVAKKVFADTEQISEYAKESVDRLQLWGILTGNENGEFLPKVFAGRAEAVCILERFLQKM